MKIVIDIGEDAVKYFNEVTPKTTNVYIFRAAHAIANATPLSEVLESIKGEIGARVFDIQVTSDKYFDGVDEVMDIVDSVIDKYGKEQT